MLALRVGKRFLSGYAIRKTDSAQGNPERKQMLRKGIAIVFFCCISVSGQLNSGPAEPIISSLKAGKYEDARKLLDAALTQSPRDVRLWTLNGYALTRLGQKSQALESYKHALRISPAYLAALEGAAEIEYQNRTQEAVPLLQRIVKIHPDDKTSHAMLAGLAFKRNDCNAAVEEFEKSEPLIDSKVSALQEYGSCLVRLNRTQQAIAVFTRISDLEISDPGARYNLAVVQSLAGRYADVIKTLSPVTTAVSDPEALDLLAEAYEANSDTPRAVETLRRAIIANPDEARFYVDFADICMAHASYKVGVDMVNAGLKRLPDSASLYLARGILYIQLGQYDQSESDFAKAEQLNPISQVGMAAQSMAALQQNDLTKAEATIRDRLKRQPDDAFLQYLLAETLARRGAAPGTPSFTDAIAAASKAIEVKSNFALARDVLGRLYLEEGNLSGAIEQSRLAVRADPTDQTALYHLILALRQDKRTDEIPKLTKQLSALREQARIKEISERKYALVEHSAAANPGEK
jgi:tetratricopeptide (TPR) repeat protein